MEQFTKTNAEKYIRSTNDAQVAQLGHLNAIINNNISLQYLTKTGIITSAEILSLSNGNAIVNLLPELSLIADNAYYIIDEILIESPKSGTPYTITPSFAGDPSFYLITNQGNFYIFKDLLDQNTLNMLVLKGSVPSFVTGSDLLVYKTNKDIAGFCYLEAAASIVGGTKILRYKITYRIQKYGQF